MTGARTAGGLLSLWLAAAPPALAGDTMDSEIDHLLDSVAASDCIFVRNGSEHGPGAARRHLALKRKRGKRHFSSAEEFIERLASSSSWSGKPYVIRCGDEEQPAGEWFSGVLREYRKGELRNSERSQHSN